MDVSGVVGRLMGVDTPAQGEEDAMGGVAGRGVLHIDKETMLPVVFLVSCQDCLPQLGEDLDMEVEFAFNDYDQPVHIPEPQDQPVLLPPPEPDDHGDDASSATPLILGQEAVGRVDTGGDIDFFSVTIEAGGAYSITVALDTLPDSTLTLFGRDGSTGVTFSDDYAETAASRVIWAADDSTYYTAVAGFEGNTGSYRLVLARWEGEVPPPTPAPPTAAQFLELDTVQAAIDAMMADKAIGFLAPSGASTNAWSQQPTGRNAAPLYPDYLESATTTYFYCWDDIGSIKSVEESTGQCAP